MNAFQIPKFEHQHVPLHKLSCAKRMMRLGHDLDMAALAIGVRSRDLDLALWRTLGNLEEGWR